MAPLKLTNFDINIQNRLKMMIKFAKKKWPNRSWMIEATFWNDTDFRLELRSCWGGKRNVVSYKKSTNLFTYETQTLENQLNYMVWIGINDAQTVPPQLLR